MKDIDSKYLMELTKKVASLSGKFTTLEIGHFSVDMDKDELEEDETLGPFIRLFTEVDDGKWYNTAEEAITQLEWLSKKPLEQRKIQEIKDTIDYHEKEIDNLKEQLETIKDKIK